jgi:hypothetical protein
MPNHILNEMIFRGVDAAQQDAIIAKLCNDEGKVDFEKLVPTPPNIWLGSVGQKHAKLGKNGLDWSRENWGTKWNAYSHKPTERTEDSITFIFETAWSPPYGWLVSVFNTLKIDFDHNWLDEGASRGVEGKWRTEETGKMLGDPWIEKPCEDEMQRHLHKLHWGVEEFTDDDAA